MDVTQAAALLALCASFDNRKPDVGAAKAWATALENVRFDDAQQAVVDHYRNEHRWIMPADVLKGVRRLVKDRQTDLSSAEVPPELDAMEDGPEFTAAYLAWLRTGEVPQKQLTA